MVVVNQSVWFGEWVTFTPADGSGARQVWAEITPEETELQDEIVMVHHERIRVLVRRDADHATEPGIANVAMGDLLLRAAAVDADQRAYEPTKERTLLGERIEYVFHRMRPELVQTKNAG